MRKLMILTAFLLVLIFIAGCQDQANLVEAPLSEQNGEDALAKSTVLNQISEVVPFAGTVFVPCANGGAGEDVAITGTGQLDITESLDGNGGYHYRYSFMPLESGGVGQETGDQYNSAGGMERQVVHVGQAGFPVNTNFTANYNYHGPNSNVRMKALVHFTYNANGVLISDFNYQEIICN
jgi:hypothetical protein